MFLCAQFVADGVFFVELNEVLTRELAKDGYSGVEVRVTPMRTKIIIKATKTQVVLASCARVLFWNLLFFFFYPFGIEYWNFLFFFFCYFVLIGEKGRRIRELTSVFQKTASMVVVAGTGEGGRGGKIYIA